MDKKLIVLDDTCKSGFGGTALTLRAIAESITDIEFIFIETKELNEELFHKIPTEYPWLIGNTFDLNHESIKILFAILQLRDFFKIEFDYGFCRYRCEQGFKKFTGLEKWEPFSDKGSKILENFYSLIKSNAIKVFYMSDKQSEIHRNMVEIPIRKQFTLGSCFSANHLMMMINEKLNRKEVNDFYAIVDGNGGWHSEAKGLKSSVLYAKENNIKFRVFKENNYERFLKTLSMFKGLIFLPIIHDTCPRLTIEAKLMGLDLIINDNCQHAKEPWFSLESEDLANYLLERPSIFRKEIEKYL